MIVTLPLNIVRISRVLLVAALELEEDASNCANNPVPENFDDLMVSMRNTYEQLQQAFREIGQ